MLQLDQNELISNTNGIKILDDQMLVVYSI